MARAGHADNHGDQRNSLVGGHGMAVKIPPGQLCLDAQRHGRLERQPAYQYNSRDQLTSEPVGVATAATNNYAFATNLLGVLVSDQLSGALTNNWQATTVDSLGQVTTERLKEFSMKLQANGVAGTADTVTATLDSVLLGGVNLSNNRWAVDLTLTPGARAFGDGAIIRWAPFPARPTARSRCWGPMTSPITMTMPGT